MSPSAGIKYLLDTCTLSDFVRGIPSVLERVRWTSPESLSISATTAMEVEFGLQLDQVRARKLQPMIEAFLSDIFVLDFTAREAKVAGRIRAALRKTLIAATAVGHGRTVVTSYVSEFARIGSLTVENWRA